MALEEGRENPGGEESVQGLLGALVGVVHQVGQRAEHAVEELGVDGDDQLFVLAGGIVVLFEVVEGELLPVAITERDEARLSEVQAAGEDRQRP